MNIQDLTRLALLVFCAVSLIVIGDTAGKALISNDVAPVFVAWTRFAVAALLLLPFSGLKREEISYFFHPLVVLRALLVAAGISSILMALKTVPIADVFGAFFIGPIISFVLAAIFLKERTSMGRVALLLFGFVGVLLVVKPGFGATPGIFFALLAGVFYGSFLVVTRAIAGGYRPRFLLISQLTIGAIVLAPFGLTGPLPPPTSTISALIGISALGSAAGNYLIVMANRRANASLIAPLIYTQLIAATIAGVLVFGDWPDIIALSGLLIILGSGLGSLWLARGRD